MIHRWAWSRSLAAVICGVAVGIDWLPQALAAEPPNRKVEASAFVSEALMKACSPYRNAQAVLISASLSGSRLILKSRLSGLPSSGFTTSIKLDELNDFEVVESTLVLRCSNAGCIDQRTDLNLPDSTRYSNEMAFRCEGNFAQRLKKALDSYMVDIPRKRSAF